MAAQANQPPKTRNLYADAMNDPKMLQRRKEAQEELDAKVQHILANNPGRVPRWERARLLQLDRFCLDHGKRCIMWDDEGPGFYLMLNWDWLRNQPAEPPSSVELESPGWWRNIQQILRPPLLDNEQPEERLAAWVDVHTMRVHGFLDKLGKLRRDEQTGRLVLDDPYWEELQQAQAWPPAAAPAGSAAAAEAAGLGTRESGATGNRAH